MRRRDFILLAGSAAAAWPIAGWAQQSKVRRIGALFVGNADIEMFRTELRDELQKSGYVEGQNVVSRVSLGARESQFLPGLAAELVARQVDLIMAVYTPCALAAQKATRDIPIVALAGDLLASGLVPSLARPGGNVTGIDDGGRVRTASALSCFVTCFHPCVASALSQMFNDPFSKLFLEQVQLAGAIIKIDIAPVAIVRRSDNIDETFATMKMQGADAVVVQGSLASKTTADFRAQTSSARRIKPPFLCRIWRSSFVRRRRSGLFPAKRGLRGEDLKGRNPRGNAG